MTISGCKGIWEMQFLVTLCPALFHRFYDYKEEGENEFWRVVSRLSHCEADHIQSLPYLKLFGGLLLNVAQNLNSLLCLPSPA